MRSSKSLKHQLWLAVFTLLAVTQAVPAAPAYDPLATSAQAKIETLDLTVQDTKRNRAIPLRVYTTKTTAPAPVVLFSHGLGGSKDNNKFLGQHWSARGYVVVFMQHPGSDTSVWQGQPLGQRMTAMNQSANVQNFQLRIKDVPAVLDQLERWNKEKGHRLWQQLDLTKVGMSGHSFGAVTTQAVSGQAFPMLGSSATDPRIKAACMFSPSSPRRARNPGRTFGSVKIPWLLMTGTKDESPIGNIKLPSRLAVYPALPEGGKYEVVLNNAEHSAFGDRILPGDKEGRNPNHHKVMLALTTAFWDAYLRNDSEALAWLNGTGPRTILEPEDRWQKK